MKSVRDTPGTTAGDAREWLAASLPSDSDTLRRVGLLQRAERHFGGWTQMLFALGIPAHRKDASSGTPDLPRDPHDLADALVGVLGDRTVARLTGFNVRAIACRRRWLDREAPRTVSRSARLPGVARTVRGVPRARRADQLGQEDLDRIALAVVRAGDQRWAFVLRQLYLLDEPRSLRSIAETLGVNRETVRQHEQRALARLGIALGPPRIDRAVRLRIDAGDRAVIAAAVKQAPREPWAVVLRGRFLQEPPRTLRELGLELGCPPTAIATLQRKGLACVGVTPEVESCRRIEHARTGS